MTHQSIEYFTAFIDELDWRGGSKLNDQRKEARLSKNLLISIQPVDQDLHNVGAAVQGVTRDISPSGMGFLCHQAMKLPQCRISLPGSRVSVLANIRHTKMVGGMPVIFQLGVEYMTAPEEAAFRIRENDLLQTEGSLAESTNR